MSRYRDGAYKRRPLIIYGFSRGFSLNFSMRTPEMKSNGRLIQCFERRERDVIEPEHSKNSGNQTAIGIVPAVSEWCAEAPQSDRRSAFKAKRCNCLSRCRNL